MSFSRRTFLGAAAASAAFSGYASLARAQEAGETPTYVNEVRGYGPLVEDPYQLFDLPDGFSYRVVSQAGETMSDGFYTPYKADGMGCFPGSGSTVILVRNHELKPTDRNFGPLGVGRRLFKPSEASRGPAGKSSAMLNAEHVYDFDD